MLALILYFATVLALGLLWRLRRQIIYALYNGQVRRDLCGVGDMHGDVPEGTENLLPRISPETLKRLRELYSRSQAAHAEFQKLFDEEAARLGLKDRELGYLSNAISGWYESAKKEFGHA